MLGHVRSEAMEKFKEMFDNALNGGKGFAVAASECSESCFKIDRFHNVLKFFRHL